MKKSLKPENTRSPKHFREELGAPQVQESLLPESNLVHEILQLDEAVDSAVTHAASASFGEIHGQLMDTIAQDVKRRAALPMPESGSLAAWLSAQIKFLDSLQRGLRPHLVQFALAAFLLVGVGMGGHYVGRKQGAQALPIQSFVDDFDEGMKSEMPLDFISADTDDATSASRWLSQHTGVKIKLPTPRKSGARILGARQKTLWNRPVAQAHYVKNGVRVGLYQVREPRCGLSGLEETSIGGRTFMTAKRGAYHVVVWRKGDDIMTMVSPLAKHQALRLAAAMRDDDSLT